MAGTKLRGAQLEAFNALGQRGKPIYSVAPQILSVLRRHETQYPGLAGIFAIPQANEDGSGLDWYAPEQGPVIAWSAATPAEKNTAYARLALAQQQISQLRTQYAGSSNEDAKLLSQLLEWAMHYPDDSHLFLVNGQAVITFWGFVLDGADRSISPLHSLGQQLQEPIPAEPPPEPAPVSSLVAAPATATAIAPAASAAAPTAPVTTRRWPWWLWLLLLLPLIALLLWLLRGCIPTTAIPAIATAPAPQIAHTQVDSTLTPVLRTPVASSASVLPLPEGATTSAGSANALVPAPAAALPSALNAATAPAPGTGNAAPAPAGESPAAAPTPAAPGSAPAAPAPVQGQAAPAEGTPTPPPFLAVPPALADGPAEFLQGGWQANSGIQDRDTGVPLKLRYEFNGGKGQAVLTGSNGVTCTAPVAANMQAHNLHITPDAAAACNDGSTYELPRVECQPNATDPSAACSGQYGERNFPLYMRQPR